MRPTRPIRLTNFFSALRPALERRLYGLGVTLPVARHLLGTQIFITGTALALGVALVWLSAWPLAFGAGAAITTYSLWQITRTAQAYVQRQFSPALALRLFLGFSARLLLIGFVLFGLIVWLRAPVAPLLLGLTSTVASIAVWGMSRFSRKTVKEA